MHRFAVRGWLKADAGRRQRLHEHISEPALFALRNELRVEQRTDIGPAGMETGGERRGRGAGEGR